jgi:hypothetical protein
MGSVGNRQVLLPLDMMPGPEQAYMPGLDIPAIATAGEQMGDGIADAGMQLAIGLKEAGRQIGVGIAAGLATCAIGAGLATANALTALERRTLLVALLLASFAVVYNCLR